MLLKFHLWLVNWPSAGVCHWEFQWRLCQYLLPVAIFILYFIDVCVCVRLRLRCDGTRAETRFRLSAKRTSPFKSAGASVQSTTGSRGVRISGSNAEYTMFRASVKGTGYPLHSPLSPSLPPPPVGHRVPSHFNWTLPPLVNYLI